jgi:hypothetical protein
MISCPGTDENRIEVAKMKVGLSLLIIVIFSFVTLGAAEDVKVEGKAVEDFHRIGAWGWKVNVDKVISGPVELQGRQISVYLTSANPAEYPPGFLDSDIKAGDRIEVYGQMDFCEAGGACDILLTGSAEYYLKRATVN